ncbi:hypothetical protein [Deinococcus yavapaiensis]|uniref:Uncharacterized protein n=1 Tax=Deinococcus yavapaiensis KR-236 TaxID=694435 RepID=A0A318SAW4_9DEIO|nr:hypothetical protein [Deinococcus yavapaiensis]PYE56208.1 hypothetical protein DES52_10112 [Deinococcus yavapaiensis KR-236]
MDVLRLLLSLVAGAGAALVAYAIAYTHGNPHPNAPDPDLAFTLLPLELVVGLVVGLFTFRAFKRRQQGEPRSDIADRMVLRVAHRQGGTFTFQDVLSRSPLGEPQARHAVDRLLESGQVRRDGDTYRLP